MNDEIKSVISGTSPVKYGDALQAIAGYLRRGQSASEMGERNKSFKEQEKERLIHYIEANSLWIYSLDLNSFVSSGAEQRVYLKDSKSVIKLNDAIYYSTWLEYFYNLLLNNYFFPDTAYKLLGFFKEMNIVYAVVEQPFVKSTEPTSLEAVKEFMFVNSFINTKNNDYYNPELGIILEDLHDENVLSCNGMLRFIDTVFYIKELVRK